MNEEVRRKREWVKTAAIIFLSVMLVLTFFSNTIMNYSLPEVAIQYVQSGTVTAKIRGSGQVESGDPYNIEVKESRKVASVAVNVGDFVEAGDVILYLADEESEELVAAQEALEQAWKDYDKLLLSEATTAAGIQAANNNTSTATFRQQITNAQNAVTAAQKKVDELQEWYNAFNLQIAMTPTNDADLGDLPKQCEEARTAYENAQAAETAAQNKVDILEQRVALLEGPKETKSGQSDVLSGAALNDNNDSNADTASDSGDVAAQPTSAATELDDLKDQLRAAQADLITAKEDTLAKKLIYDQLKVALDNKKASGDTSSIIENLKIQQAQVNVDLTRAQAELEDKKEALSKLTGTVNSAVALSDQMDVINKAQEKVDELTAKSVDATITADISGTVTAVNVTAGNTTSAATPVAVLQPEGKGYTMSFSVTNEQAKRLAVGDKADLVNAWRFDDVEVTLASIKPDPNDPGQKKLLTFDVTGAVTAGQTLNISVGQKSANYDYIVPNNSIREDNNGKFILVVTSKSSPLGTRYYATRVDVEVLASDDSQSAVSSGMLTGYDPVITTSTKPVEAGKLVRLAEN